MIFLSTKIDFHNHLNPCIAMPHFLRVKNSALHVPSISNVIMYTGCLGGGFLRIYYHNSTKSTSLSYSDKEAWWTDYKRIKEAMAEVDKLLNTLPLTDSSPPTHVVKDSTQEIVVETEKTS